VCELIIISVIFTSLDLSIKCDIEVHIKITVFCIVSY